MRHLVRISALLLVACTVCAAWPRDAEAQGWRWIRKLSGPDYPFVPTARFGVCLEFSDGIKITCGETAYGFHDPSPNRRFEVQVGSTIGYSFGVGGDNDDTGIMDTSVFTLDVPELRVLLLRTRRDDRDGLAVVPVFAVGYGLSRFSGGTIPDTFWQSSVALSFGARFPNPVRNSEGWRLGGKVGTYIEGGAKLRRYFPALTNEQFGATTAVGEVDPWGLEFYALFGFRFGGVERR